MEKKLDHELLLAAYFKGDLSDEQRVELDQWKEISDENKAIFEHSKKVHQSLRLLNEMRRYKAPAALQKVNSSIGKSVQLKQIKLWQYWQQVAAILLLPIVIGGLIYFSANRSKIADQLVWQTITTPPGIKSKAELPDGTMVWLNSGSSLRYPSAFDGEKRNVELKGEAFFDVHKDKSHPFIVELGKIGIEVLGTEFNVINYERENQMEIVLASGKIRLVNSQPGGSKTITEMNPGQQAIIQKKDSKFSLHRVDTEKYTSWIDGKLIFRDDPMEEVARKLSRWFNVDIELADQEVAQYVYTATFQNETLDQIINLFERTSPISYTVVPPQTLAGGELGKQKIIIKRR